MGRLGFPPEALTEPFWESVRELRVVAVMSHFSSADDQKSSYVETQLRCFDRTTEDLPCQRTIANSGGIFGWPKAHFDWIRPGLALYGVSPFRGFQSEALELVPVMHLESRLIAIRRMKKGQPIGYGGTWVCPEDMIVGIVGCGYGDGYPRSAANHGVARVGPHVLPMIGNISMDSMAVDLRGYPDGSIGERVTLWGRDFPVESVAETAGTIPNDLLVRVTARVPRKPIV